MEELSMYQPHLYQYDPESIITLTQLLIQSQNNPIKTIDPAELSNLSASDLSKLQDYVVEVFDRDDISKVMQQDNLSSDRIKKLNRTILLSIVNHFLRSASSNGEIARETTLRHTWLFEYRQSNYSNITNQDLSDKSSANDFFVIWDDLSNTGLYCDETMIFERNESLSVFNSEDYQNTFNQSHYSPNNCHIIKLVSPEQADAVISFKLNQLLNVKLHQSAVSRLRNVFEFWSLQLDQLKLKHDDDVDGVVNEISSDRRIKEKELLQFLATALKSLAGLIERKSSAALDHALTFGDIVSFYNEVQVGELTNLSLPVLNQLASVTALNDEDQYSLTDVISLYQHHDNYENIVDHIAPITQADYDWLTKMFNKDHWYRDKTDYKIDTIIKLDLPETRNLAKYPDHFTGIHGTNDESVPSILLNGLMNNEELQQFAQKSKSKLVKYDESGTALGVGVYFGRIDQVSKPLLYANGRAKDEAYLIIADVAYNKKSMQKIKWQSWTGEHNKSASLVWATRTGVRGKDEVLTPITKNIKIKYILKLKSQSSDDEF